MNPLNVIKFEHKSYWKPFHIYCIGGGQELNAIKSHNNASKFKSFNSRGSNWPPTQ